MDFQSGDGWKKSNVNVEAARACSPEPGRYPANRDQQNSDQEADIHPPNSRPTVESRSGLERQPQANENQAHAGKVSTDAMNGE
jgi:hypothetical protein